MQITLDIPEQYLLDESPAELGRRIRLYAALLMFQSGELSAGAASELAQVDRFTFAAECGKHGIPLISYPADELQAELESLRHTL
jgi:predicted HTH domain antitoxin